MVGDILQRLRRWSHTEGCGCTRCTAANEIERLTSRNLKLEAVYEAANGVAINKGAARELAVNILIDVIAAVQTTVRPGDLLK